MKTAVVRAIHRTLVSLLLLSPVLAAAATQTVVLQQGLNGYQGTDDTYINNNSKTVNYGSLTNIYFSRSDQKSLLRFDLSSIPANATINSATLGVYIYGYNNNGGGNTIRAHRALQNWSESAATWNIYAAGQNWQAAGMGSGTDYTASVAATATVGYTPANVWGNFTLTSLVQSWVNGSAANQGVMLLAGNGPRPYIYSSEYAGNAALRPKLTITYTTTGGGADTTAPSVPQGLNATAASTTQINLSWSASTDNVAVTGYKVYRGGVQVGTATGTTFASTGLTANTAYTHTVAAYDAAGNTSAQSAAASATTQSAADTTAPSVPQGLNATAASTTQINLAWTASTDNVGVTGYKVYRNGSQVGTVAGTSYSSTGLAANTTYSHTVAAYDAAGNNSAQSAAASATTQSSADTAAPSVPQGLNATAASASRIDLTWAASTDNVGVTGYTVYRNGASVGTSVATNYADTGLAASTTYTYTVAAYDAAGNGSAQSASRSATTQASGNGFTFLTYGDNRADGTNCDGNAVHIGLVSRMVAENPALVINNGDMILGYGRKTNFIQDGDCTAPTNFGSFKNQIAPLQNRTPPPGLPTAYFPVIGNHDDNWGSGWYPDPFGNGICDVFSMTSLVPNHTQQPWYSSLRSTKYTNSQFASLTCSKTDKSVYPTYMYYSFNHANSHFVVLRINSDYYDLEVCNSCSGNKSDYDDYYYIHQLDFVRADLAAARANPQVQNIFVFVHVPLFGSSADHNNNPSWRALGKEFTTYGVKAVFSGHSHLYERSVPVAVNAANPDGVLDNQNGTVYVTTGGGGSPLHGFKSPAPWYKAVGVQTYHYVKVQVDGPVATIQAINSSGQVIDSFTR
jgi:chitodextrinase